MPPSHWVIHAQYTPFFKKKFTEEKPRKFTFAYLHAQLIPYRVSREPLEFPSKLRYLLQVPNSSPGDRCGYYSKDCHTHLEIRLQTYLKNDVANSEKPLRILLLFLRNFVGDTSAPRNALQIPRKLAARISGNTLLALPKTGCRCLQKCVAGTPGNTLQNRSRLS